MPGSEQDTLPRTLEDALDRILRGLSDEDRAWVASTSESDLILFHHGWGTGIRNSFGLCGRNTALLSDCGSADMHADDASGVIIQAVWNKLHGLPIGNARLVSQSTSDEMLNEARNLGPESFYRRFYAGRRDQGTYKIMRHLFQLNYQQFLDIIAKVCNT